MKVAPLILLLGLCTVYIARPQQPPSPVPHKPPILRSPKDSAAQSGMAMAVPEDDTNTVWTVTVLWQHPNQFTTSGFTLFVSDQPGAITNWTEAVQIEPSLSNAYTFPARTNWPGFYSMHFFAMVAWYGTNQTVPSNEAHFPPYPPDHVALTWAAQAEPVTIEAATTFPPVWVPVGTITTNYWAEVITPGRRFYRATISGSLTITAFNPRN